jgi:hypothetical protein
VPTFARADRLTILPAAGGADADTVTVAAALVTLVDPLLTVTV